jgi:toxin ParE1/3/4
MPVILRRPRARDDIAEIWNYIAEDGERQADAFVDRLDTKFQLLARQPRLGFAREELAPGLRSFPVGRYVIFYELIQDGIAIVRVLHGARDVDVQFAGDPKEG